jgi:aryl-alcohol dehydrogenase-like predicted oxidoreductase
MGLGVIPSSPLANGVLSGKYSRADLRAGDLTSVEGSRKDVAIGYGSLSERSLDIADVVKAVAAETGHSAAQVALAWTLLNSGVATTLIGARTLKQLDDNLGALEVSIDDEQRARLERVSAVALGFPHELLRMPTIIQSITGGTALPARSW